MATPVGFSKGQKQQAKIDTFGLGVILNKVRDCNVALTLYTVVGEMQSLQQCMTSITVDYNHLLTVYI